MKMIKGAKLKVQVAIQGDELRISGKKRDDLQGAIALVIATFAFLMIIGALMTGERGVISPRAQRTLPKTFLGRIFLTWLYPGAGLGYIYLICLFAALVVTLSAVELYYESTMSNFFGRESVLAAGFLLLCYLTIYLGVNRLIMMSITM